MKAFENVDVIVVGTGNAASCAALAPTLSSLNDKLSAPMFFSTSTAPACFALDVRAIEALIAREKAEAPCLDEVFEARVQLVEGRGAEELVGREMPVEGDAVEAEEGGIHQSSPS